MEVSRRLNGFRDILNGFRLFHEKFWRGFGSLVEGFTGLENKPYS